MTITRRLTGASLLAITAALGASPAFADSILSGAITSATGEKMGGVLVSAKAEGSTITTSVYTDEAGNYYFPKMVDGKYKVWAQAIKYETAKGDVELKANKAQNFTLQPMKDQEAWIQQLPGDEFLAALPDATPEDARMKVQVRKNCTGCHSASFPLQHRFDEAGWNKILTLMKHVNVLGTYQGADHKATANIDFHQKELAAYLARARGPGESSMKFNLRPRPTGEAARVVFKEYDFPLEGGHAASNDGSDWSLGTPSGMNHVNGVHDAYADFSGNLWFTYAHPGFETTVGKIDAKTGATKSLRLEDQKGYAVGSHGITRDENGNLWFNTRSNVARGHGGLGKIDPKTDKLTVYLPPRSTTGTAGTLDADMAGNIWVTEPDGALRFDIAKETFTEFKSVTYKNERGTATVYGLAADRTGNGWWLLMQQDKIDFSDIKTGKTGEIGLPVDKNAMASLTPEDLKFYDTYVPPDFNNPIAWGQSPRRMGADHNGDYVYVGNSFGGNLAKINIRTKETTIVPLPNPDSMQPYQVSIDQNHNVWTNLWSTDAVARLDPTTNKWTLFDLPNRGTETRHISLLERDGQPMQVIIPYSRTRKVAVMTIRTEADIAALKSEASR